jgi:hypothetical protein
MSNANADYSFVAGKYCNANMEAQTVCGQYSAYDTQSLFVVGVGTSINDLKNGFCVTPDGRAQVLTAPSADSDVVRLKELTAEKLARTSSITSSSVGASTELVPNQYCINKLFQSATLNKTRPDASDYCAYPHSFVLRVFNGFGVYNYLDVFWDYTTGYMWYFDLNTDGETATVRKVTSDTPGTLMVYYMKTSN